MPGADLNRLTGRSPADVAEISSKDVLQLHIAAGGAVVSNSERINDRTFREVVVAGPPSLINVHIKEEPTTLTAASLQSTFEEHEQTHSSVKLCRVVSLWLALDVPTRTFDLNKFAGRMLLPAVSFGDMLDSQPQVDVPKFPTWVESSGGLVGAVGTGVGFEEDGLDVGPGEGSLEVGSMVGSGEGSVVVGFTDGEVDVGALDGDVEGMGEVGTKAIVGAAVGAAVTHIPRSSSLPRVK